MNYKNLLLITHTYNDFVKDQTEIIAQNFTSISVCVRYNIALKYLSYLPFQRFDNYKIDRHLDLNNIPTNITVYPTEILYWSSDSQTRKLGDLHLSKLVKDIRKKTIRFDMIHAHFTWSSGYVGARLKEKFGVPFVVTAHGYDIYDLPFKDGEWREKIGYVLNTADHIITVSKSNLACIDKLNVSTPVTVIPNGFRSDLFYSRDSIECRKLLNLPQDKKIILTIGNLEPVKGHKYLIDSVNEIIGERKDILCIIVGVGSKKHTLENQIRSQGLKDHIMLVGGKTHDEIPLWMNACDIFVLPSLNEGNPTVMFEALGCGKPFVGTKVGGVPEVILFDDYGLLVKPADAGDLADKIMMALDREWDQQRILAYAEQFRWENISKEILQIYQKVGIRTKRDLEKE